MKTLQFWVGIILMLMNFRTILMCVYGHPPLTDDQFVGTLIFAVIGALISLCVIWNALGKDK